MLDENPQKFEKKKSEQNFLRQGAISKVKIARLDDAFSEYFELTESPVEGQRSSSSSSSWPSEGI